LKKLLNLQYDKLDSVINNGSYSKICVEIGCGNGAFMLNYTQKHRDELIIGFDVSSLSVVKSANLLEKNKIKNAFVLKFDARFMGMIFDHRSLDKIFMNYPIPWIRKPKRRSHRVVTNRFVRQISKVLKTGGEFRMISDSKWYVDYVAGKFLSTEFFRLFDYHSSKKPFINTKYEKKWLEEGRALYWLEIINTSSKYYKKEEDLMPHVFLNKIDEDKILNVKNESFVLNDSGYVYKKSYRGKEEIIIKTISIDEGFNQNYFIKVVKRNDKYMVKLDDFSRPIITESVKKSIFNFKNFIE
jgi:tRNA (guanine-N7-)-methyltransferase